MNKKVMVITGTRKGIGKYLAEYYTQLGFSVIGCSRSQVDIELPNYHHFCLDVADESSVKKLFSYVRKNFVQLDVLINNAGIASMNHTLLTPLSSVDKIMSTNFKGTFLFCREAAKIMQRKHFGRIINFATVASPLKLEGEAIYAASKAAIVNFTQILAYELGEMGITVNAVGPTPIQTDLIRGVPQDKINALINMQAIKRLGEYHDVSNAIDFLIQEESDFITGQVIYLGGIS